MSLDTDLQTGVMNEQDVVKGCGCTSSGNHLFKHHSPSVKLVKNTGLLDANMFQQTLHPCWVTYVSWC